MQILERQFHLKYIKVDIKAHLEPKIRPVIAIPNICSVSGTVVNGNGIDIWAKIDTNAANKPHKIISLVVSFIN